MKKLLLITCSFFVFIFNANATVHIITAQDFTFSPSAITINLGDTVKWVWSNGTHTTTSESIPAGAAAWSQNLKSSSASFTYVPAVTGVYHFQCNFHVSMGMIGTITVNAATCPPVTATIHAASNTTFCHGDSVMLNSSVTGNVSAYQWCLNSAAISGQTKTSYIADATGSYTLRVSGSCGSKDTSNAVSVTTNPLPKAVITPSGTVNMCAKDSTLLTADAQTVFTYQWIRNNAAIVNAVSKTYAATKAGSYKIMVTNKNTGCIKNSLITKIVIMDCLTETAFSKTATTTDELKIYPDPVAQHLALSITSAILQGALQISVYNASGEKVKNITAEKNENYFQQDIDMSNFVAGLYFVQISDGKNRITQKFVKQ